MSGWGDVEGVVVFPDGVSVRGTGLRRDRDALPPPDFAVYLQGRDPRITTWPSRWVRWPDFRLPHSDADALDALREAHRRAAVERVEIACGAGIGRTGTALCVLGLLSGIDPGVVVDWVRAHYHPRAVETRAQRAWIATVAAVL
ncbi:MULTISPECIES: protein-tyrosine phosphatase family protein [Brevibacterium]|nr:MULTISPECIES: protein-tyrosine phosphatase family protein [Brevibacterium]